ncbi:MAG TPA: hypothetical protein DG048_18760 [Pseudoalteromonas sp.]|nr:hypothetical protein [Pseudoalteromonas sp.]|tara:strand:+ start:237 stop:524 length:288 start_codon:yes stop_codon:yes gene_type:complete
MLIRECSKGRNIKLYRNTTPNSVYTYTQDQNIVSLTYPADKQFFVVKDNVIIHESNNFTEIENYYVDEVIAENGSSLGVINWVKHKLINFRLAVR